MFRKVWKTLKGETPARRVQLRAAEIQEALVEMASTWPGVISAWKDGKKAKIVVDDEGQGLVVMVWVDVKPRNLKVREAQERRRADSARRLREKANATESPPGITGRLNLKVSEEQLAKMREGR